ncbi:SAM-dependent methyltransferase [Kitasatospora sp. RB6PN24]|uniref:SAM-dependent methyltransferase n=1 Tax=Kitasatospora humi TaxID=2893891 RepID=UPI001E549A2F|nr:SAM-dependent methyltransferase [Kitasatospora humi]MCC9309162.1 SAM-dependent methyltransferase [Kitasatospora humi]
MTVLKTDQAAPAEQTVAAGAPELGGRLLCVDEWEPASGNLELRRPTRARLDDTLLGGKDNLPPDRAAAEALLKVAPAFRQSLHARREFAVRALSYLARVHGVRDVLVLGAGLPAEPAVHAVVQAVQPAVRAVYVDDDPMVLTHLRARLNCRPPGRIAAVLGQLGRPEELLATSPVKALLEPGRPVVLVVESALEFMPDEQDPQGCLAALVEALPPGSWVVLAHATADFTPKAWEKVAAVFARHRLPIHPRSVEEVAGFLDGLRLSAPGLTVLNRWPRLTDQLTPAEVSRYGAVGRKSGVR